MTVEVSYTCLTQAAEVLARQERHSLAIERYLRAEGGIHDDTGLLLALLAPPAWAVLEAGARVTRLTGQIGAVAADQVTRSRDAYVAQDRQTYEQFARAAQALGMSMPAWQDPTEGIASVGAAKGGAPDGYGAPTQWFTADVATGFVRNAVLPPVVRDGANALVTAQGVVAGVSQSAGQLGDAATGLGREVMAWGGPAAAVAETADPTSYLVTPDLGLNEVQELRWSAGVLIGGLDWLAEQLLGFSILEEVVFKPFAGDFQDIKRASMAWANVSCAFTAIGENFAGLLSPTMSGWRGEAGDAFRAGMAVCAGGFVGFSQAALSVSGLVQTIAYASQAACIAIGMILKSIAEKLLRMAVEAAVPIAGWLAASVEAVLLIHQILGWVRLAYTVIEAIVDAIDNFIQSKTAVLQSLAVVEDLAEYVARRAMA